MWRCPSLPYVHLKYYCRSEVNVGRHAEEAAHTCCHREIWPHGSLFPHRARKEHEPKEAGLTLFRAAFRSAQSGCDSRVCLRSSMMRRRYRGTLWTGWMRYALRSSPWQASWCSHARTKALNSEDSSQTARLRSHVRIIVRTGVEDQRLC